MAGMTPTNFPIMGGNPFGFSNNLLDTNFETGGFFSGAAPDADKSNTDAFESVLQRYERAKAAGVPDQQAMELARSGGEDRTRTDMDALKELVQMGFDPNIQKPLLDMKLDFERQRMKEAAPYKLLFGMPQQLGQLAAMELAGAGKFAQIMDAGQRAMPSLTPGPTRAQARQAVKYF